eukprot:CCRYP_002969-RA/>CCRYP_002969-RA protein AED:0.00 eAED:0.00 QI:30/1/1/1/0/0.5/2/417/156
MAVMRSSCLIIAVASAANNITPLNAFLSPSTAPLLTKASVLSRQVPTSCFVRRGGDASLRMLDKVAEIEVVTQPTEEFLEKKGVFSWSKWSCPPSKFPWTYDSTESCYLLQGQVTVTPTDGRKPATFGKGDFVTFPSGMSCTWDVSEGVEKHYMFY